MDENEHDDYEEHDEMRWRWRRVKKDESKRYPEGGNLIRFIHNIFTRRTARYMSSFSVYVLALYYTLYYTLYYSYRYIEEK